MLRHLVSVNDSCGIEAATPTCGDRLAVARGQDVELRLGERTETLARLDHGQLTLHTNAVRNPPIEMNPQRHQIASATVAPIHSAKPAQTR